MKKNLSVVIIFTMLLSSCTFQDNKANNKMTDRAKLVPTSLAYDGYEEYWGKDYHKFKLPQSINKIETNNIYILKCNIQEYQTDSDEIKNIYQKFYGESYDEDMLITDSYGGLIYLADENSSSYWGTDLTLMESSFEIPDYSDDENPLKGRFITDLQSEETVSVSAGEYVIHDECQFINKYTNDLLEDFYNDWSFQVKDIYVESIEGKTRLDFSSCLMYESMPMQYSNSEYFVTDNDRKTTYWIASEINGVIEDDRFVYINAVVPYTVLNKTKQESIIPFPEAVRILEEEIAENAGFEFVNVELMYCSLAVQPFLDYSPGADFEETDKLNQEYQQQAKTFEPYWCFEIANENISKTKRYVKVNALTGELFIDMN